MRIDRRNDLNLKLLEIFGAVMETGTATAAAEVLGLSQPAVSAALRQLEHRLGVVLFERAGRRLVPTEAAHLLQAEAQPVFLMLDRLSDGIRRMKHHRAGRLRIAATPPMGHSFAPGALREFLRDRPAIEVQFDVLRLAEVQRAVDLGVADLGLGLGLAENAGVRTHVLSEAELVAVVPRDHVLTTRAVLGPADLARYPLIGLDSVIATLVEGAFALQGVPFRPRLQARYTQTACALVQAGLGVAVVDPFTAGHIAGNTVAVRRLQPAVRISAVAMTREGQDVPPLVNEFLEILRRRIETAPPTPRL
ncbi:MAG: LysR family transcriptional regulator [Gemmobacter sp.]